jgi:hypothetical protein
MTEQKKKMSKGCMIALISGLVILVLLIGLAVVCYIYKDKIIEAGLNGMVTRVAEEIKKDLPEGVTAQDIDQLVEDFKQASRDKQIHADQVKELSTMLSGFLTDKKIDHKEAEEFIAKLQEIIDNYND